jgi:hypothetical protein
LNLQALKITLCTEHTLRRIPPLTVILTGTTSRSFTIICAGSQLRIRSAAPLDSPAVFDDGRQCRAGPHQTEIFAYKPSVA